MQRAQHPASHTINSQWLETAAVTIPLVVETCPGMGNGSPKVTQRESSSRRWPILAPSFSLAVFPESQPLISSQQGNWNKYSETMELLEWGPGPSIVSMVCTLACMHMWFFFVFFFFKSQLQRARLGYVQCLGPWLAWDSSVWFQAKGPLLEGTWNIFGETVMD